MDGATFVFELRDHLVARKIGPGLGGILFAES